MPSATDTCSRQLPLGCPHQTKVWCWIEKAGESAVSKHTALTPAESCIDTFSFKMELPEIELSCKLSFVGLPLADSNLSHLFHTLWLFVIGRDQCGEI